jgi:hypothetical protein
MDAKLIDELVKQGYEPSITRPESFGVTVTEYAEKWHCSDTIARRLLDDAKEAGILEMHLMQVGTYRTAVYHRPKDWPPGD